MTIRPAALDAAAYTRLYESEYPRLVGYARTLTGNPWTAGDLVAEAHFRIWRRLREGEPIDADAAPGELTSAVRGLAVASVNWGPPQQASLLEPLIRVLGELPQRWVAALWLAEAEALPPEEAARRTRTSAEAAAALVERARESLRHEFLRAHPGTPVSAACGGHWDGLPGHVLGTDDPHQAEQIAVHIDGCPDCRTRMERLVAADGRLAALTGPALLALYDRGTAPYLRPLAAAGGWATTGAAAAGAGTAGVGGPATVPIGGASHAAPANGPLVSGRRSMRHLMHGQVREAGPVAVAVAGAGVLFVAGAAVMTGLALTNGGAAEAGQPAAVSAPHKESPDSSATSGSSGSSGTSGTDATDAASRKPSAPHADGTREASRSRPSAKAPGPSDVPSSAVSPSRSTPSSAPSAPSSKKPTTSPDPSESGSTPTSKPTSKPTSEPSSPSQDPTNGGGDSGGGGGTSDQQGKPGNPTAAPTDDSQNCVSLLVKLCVNK
ncbi:RNA polymerase sigma factor [Streptomyces sp. NPDC021212]|uniref:RNA polymerase sigma factor n=1 Tax=Streptomyces sp. NPDC021212 TaxID=3365118 RepID=UPI0037B34BB8